MDVPSSMNTSSFTIHRNRGFAHQAFKLNIMLPEVNKKHTTQLNHKHTKNKPCHHSISTEVVQLWFTLALYPGLLTPMFVACSTIVEEGLVKLIVCSDVPGRWFGCAEEWIHSFCTAVGRLSDPEKRLPDVSHSVLHTRLRSVALPLAVFPGMCHSSTHPSNIQTHHCM